MECWAFSKRKSWLYCLLILMMILILMVGQTQGDCIEEERKALLEIKASHMKSYDSNMDQFLPTWVDYGNSTRGHGGIDCCDWERINCNTTTGHVTELSLYNLRGLPLFTEGVLWPLNVSLFLNFRELRSLNLSRDYLDNVNIKAGLARLSSLKKLEVLDLSYNDDIYNDILPSLRTLTSLKILNLHHTGLGGYFSINEFAALENLEMLDLGSCGFGGKFKIQGSGRVSILRKLKTLHLGSNEFNESIITSINTLSSLTNLDLNYGPLFGAFPAVELIHFPNLETLDLSITNLNSTPDIQACKSLSRLKMLESLYLFGTRFDESIISCLSALPSLKILDLSYCALGGSFPVQAFASFHHLEVLYLTANSFVGSVPSAIRELSSLRVLTLAYNNLNGSLPDHGLCELKNLNELDLSGNMLHGTLPQCLNNLSSLKMLDISFNRFTGILMPSPIANLTSLEYIDFSHNKFEGSFSLSSFSNHSKLEAIQFSSDHDKFVVETEEPIDWIPMFQLEILVLCNCNMKMPKGRVIPGFLFHQHKLREVDMSYNSLEGHFPNWLVKNNTNLERLNLMNNSFVSMPLYKNANMKWLDMSGNAMIGTIPDHMPKFFPNISHLNLSRNSLSGVIPSSIGELSELSNLDLSNNKLSGEVPRGLFTNVSRLTFLKLSRNKLYGQVLSVSGNLSWGNIRGVYLDNNHFTGKIEIKSNENLERLNLLDISNNFFIGMIPDWISNMGGLYELVVRNNSFEGNFPCGLMGFSFLDISQNSFSGPIPSCSNFQYVRHLHLGSNRFTGSIPNFFRNLTQVLTLDIGNNDLSGMIPKFIGQLSSLRILILRKNNFSGSIPEQLCHLRNVSLIDLSGNSISGSIPSCLQNITGPSGLAFMQEIMYRDSMDSSYRYEGILHPHSSNVLGEALEIQDEVQFTTKELFLSYKGGILNYMAGLDLSCNKLTGEIPEELGLLIQIRALNLSHNQLTGPIPVNFSNLANIESLDLSSNGLTGNVPSELIKLTSLSTFNVSHNNLSGKLPEMQAQFGTFTEASYEGNPLLCGPPLKKNCTTDLQVTNSSVGEGNEIWYDIDMTSFYGSSSSTCVVILLGFIALLYINPQWRRRWLDWIEDCMFSCYYFLYDFGNKLSTPSHK